MNKMLAETVWWAAVELTEEEVKQLQKQDRRRDELQR